MNEIQLNKPINQLKNADPRIKTYILELENKLQNTLLLEDHGRETEITCLDLQEELFALKLQKEENDQAAELYKQQMQRLRIEIDRITCENVQLKLEVNRLRNKLGVAGSGVVGQFLLDNRASASSLVAGNQTSNCNKTPNVVNKDITKSDADDQADANSVLVKGISEERLHKDPKENIIKLARNLKISISKNDIEKVYTKERKFYERHNLKPKETLLVVQFSTPELKVEFLKNKEKLKLQGNTKDIEIIDYVSDDVYNLYQYAKILKSHGYVSVYWRNNCIYAKKTRSSFCEPILIKSTKEVDVLKNIK